MSAGIARKVQEGLSKEKSGVRDWVSLRLFSVRMQMLCLQHGTCRRASCPAGV